jgi:SAM-dependent methyltransferase
MPTPTTRSLTRPELARKIDNSDILRNIEFLPNGNSLLDDANHGLRHIEPHVAKLNSGSKILEVGSGPCLLLAHLSATFTDCSFRGVEPIGPGFEIFRACLSNLKKTFNFELLECSYDQLKEADGTQYDLIFLVNVFEHLPDWRDFLHFVKIKLKPNGRCVILCPNYSFPYESHFGIPIIFSKAITYTIFRKKIKESEEQRSFEGLWSSLNFVKLRHVCAEAARLDLEVKAHPSIINDLVERLNSDINFRQRHNFIGACAKVLHRVGFLRLFQIYPLQMFLPYMHLEINIRPR